MISYCFVPISSQKGVLFETSSIFQVLTLQNFITGGEIIGSCFYNSFYPFGVRMPMNVAVVASCHLNLQDTGLQEKLGTGKHGGTKLL